jgi:hypothetical protein
MMSDIIRLENHITLLKETLRYYADEENYVERILHDRELSSAIEIDGGSLAREVIKTVEKVDDVYKSAEDELEKQIKSLKENEDLSGLNVTQELIEIQDMINHYKEKNKSK